MRAARSVGAAELEWFDLHKDPIEELLSSAVNELFKSQTADPRRFLADFFAASATPASQSSKEVEELSTVVGGLRKQCDAFVQSVYNAAKEARDVAELSWATKSNLLNAQDSHGRTALLHATAEENVAAVRRLLEAGADRKILDNEQRTAIMLAETTGNTELFEVIRSFDSAVLHGEPAQQKAGAEGEDEVPAEASSAKGALLVDSGTGEMKLIALFSFGVVQLHELTTVKFPKGMDMGSVAVMGAGDPHDTSKMTAEFREITSKLSEGFEVLRGSEWFPRVEFTQCFIGATAWYRNLESGEARHAAATTFLDDLKANLQALLTASNIKAPVTWSCISEDDEAQYEFKAVEYATKCAGHAAPTANIGMGSGSVQLVAYDAKNRYGACMPHSATACPCPISRGV